MPHHPQEPHSPPLPRAREGPLGARKARNSLFTPLGDGLQAGFLQDGGAPHATPSGTDPLVLRVRLGHLASPGTLRALVERHLARTRAELAEIRDARLRAERTEEWQFRRIALDWSERRPLAE